MTALSFKLNGTRAGRDDGGADATQAVPEPPQETGGVPGPAPQPEPAAQQGAQMTLPAQLWATVRFAFRAARLHGKDIAAAEGGWVNAALNGKPPSVNEQRSYLANRRWLEPGHEGGIADFLGEGYHVTYGIVGVAAGDFVSWLFAKPFHSVCAGGVFLITVLAACALTGLPAVRSVLVTAVLAVIMAAPVGLAAGVLAARRAGARWWADRRTVTVPATQEEGDS
jgi:hypothetical protein